MSGVERTPRRKAEGGDEQRTLKRQFHSFLEKLKREGAPIRFRKNWGGRIAGAGEPDYTGCAQGRYWAVELKHPGLLTLDVKPSPRQAIELDDIKKAGGYTFVTNNLEDAKKFIHSLLELRPTR